MNFVAEWMTMSAPSSSGCCSSGVANVLSTTMRVPARRGAAQIAATSAVVEQRVGRRLQPQQVGLERLCSSSPDPATGRRSTRQS